MLPCPPGSTLFPYPTLFRSQECVRTLSYALRLRAVTIDTEGLARCKKELEERLVGCDWIGLVGPQTPKVCQQRSEEHTSELQSRFDLVCRLLLAKKNTTSTT